MRIPSFKRLVKNDFDEKDKPFVEKFSFFFNNSIETLFSVLNRNVSLKDNILGVVKDITVTVDATGKPTNSTSFSLDISNKIIGLNVLRVDNLTNSTGYPSGGVFVSWTQDGKNVFINHITGLVASNSYSIRVIAYGD